MSNVQVSVVILESSLNPVNLEYNHRFRFLERGWHLNCGAFLANIEKMVPIADSYV